MRELWIQSGGSGLKLYGPQAEFFHERITVKPLPDDIQKIIDSGYRKCNHCHVVEPLHRLRVESPGLVELSKHFQQYREILLCDRCKVLFRDWLRRYQYRTRFP